LRVLRTEIENDDCLDGHVPVWQGYGRDVKTASKSTSGRSCGKPGVKFRTGAVTMEEQHLSWISILLLCVQLFGFAVRFLYSAVFGLRDRSQQPLSYSEVRRGLWNWYFWASIICILALWVNGRYFLGIGLVACQLLLFHLRSFLNYRRAVIGIAEARDSNGRYLLEGNIAQRERTAMSIVDFERKNGDRE
jgi:hypothetical protein